MYFVRSFHRREHYPVCLSVCLCDMTMAHQCPFLATTAAAQCFLRRRRDLPSFLEGTPSLSLPPSFPEGNPVAVVGDRRLLLQAARPPARNGQLHCCIFTGGKIKCKRGRKEARTVTASRTHRMPTELSIQENASFGCFN